MRSLHPWPTFPTHLDPEPTRALALQFLIDELFLAFDLLSSLQTLLSQKPEVLEELESLSTELEKFLLFSLENPLSQKGGSLDKLCFYFQTLLQNSCVGEETEVPDLLEKMRGLVLRLKANIASSKKVTMRGALQEISEKFLHLMTEFESSLQQVFDSLFVFIWESREDENILFMLVEQRGKINRYVGDRTVETLLSRLFPDGLSSFRSVLYNGYRRRGFLDFYAKNEGLIDALQWEDTCSLSNLKP